MGQERGWRVAGRAVMFVVFSTVLLGVAARYLGRVPNGALLVGVSTAIATLLLTVAFTRMEGLRLQDVGASYTRESLGRFAIAFAAGLTLPFVRAGIGMLLSGLRYERAYGVSGREMMLTLATFIAFASREELQFRGFALRILDRRFGTGIALMVIAVLFAAEHMLAGAAWWQALLGAGMGSIFFGVAALRTRGLAVPIGLHAAWNCGDWMLGGKGSGGVWRPAVEADALWRVEVAQWAAYLVVMALAATVLWRWPRERRAVVEN